MSRDELAKLFTTHTFKGHKVFDLNGKSLKLGDTVFNSKTNAEAIIDERAMKTFDFGIEVLGLNSVMKNLRLLEEDILEEVAEIETLEGVEATEQTKEIDTADEDENTSREISFYEDEEDEEEWENACDGGCEIPKAKKIDLNKSKELKRLEKLFDLIEITQYDKYQTLTIKDKANRDNIDWIVWFDIKLEINGGGSKSYGHSKSSEEYILAAVKQIDTFSELIVKFRDDNTKKTLSLFEDENTDEVILEKEPERPSPSSEGNEWTKYYREQEEVQLRNAMKKYTFLELVHLSNSWYSYLDSDNELFNFENHLPANDKEIIELIKNSIIEVTKEDRKAHGRFQGFWWDNSCQYVEYGGVFSDLELISRVSCIARLYLVPYKNYKKVYIDDSNTVHEFYNAEQTSYHFYFDGGDISGRNFSNLSFEKDKKRKSYDLYDSDFIAWLRDWFKIEYKENMSDEDAIKASLLQYYGEITEEFELENAIRSVKSEEEFIELFNSKKTKRSFEKDKTVSIRLEDGYEGTINLKGGKKDSFVLEQRLKAREAVLKEKIECDGYCFEFFRIEGVTNIHKKAFELFCDKEELERQAKLGQKSLF